MLPVLSSSDVAATELETVAAVNDPEQLNQLLHQFLVQVHPFLVLLPPPLVLYYLSSYDILLVCIYSYTYLYFK